MTDEFVGEIFSDEEQLNRNIRKTNGKVRCHSSFFCVKAETDLSASRK